MKIVFLSASGAILYLMTRGRGIRATYDASHDTFRIAFLIVPSALLAALIHADSSPLELAWTFSIYLEAVAILPQLVLLQRTGNVDNLTGDYVFLLGTYRGFYLLNWVYRAWTEPGYRQWIGESRVCVCVCVLGFFFPCQKHPFSLTSLTSSLSQKNTHTHTHTSLDLRHRADRPVPGLFLLLPPRVEAQREAVPAVVRVGRKKGRACV
jgi:hypothetical protein